MTIYLTKDYRVALLFTTLAVATAANWVLVEGEVWREKHATTGRFTGRSKTGDGIVSTDKTTITGTAFNDLPFDPTGTGGPGSTDLSLGTRTATELVVASSSGEDVTLPAATEALAGLMTGASQVKLNSILVNSALEVRIYVRNNSGVEIPKGSPCYQTGSSGTTITIALADASAEETASQTLGLAENAIPSNSFGYLKAVGLLDGINTSSLVEGKMVWLSETTGALTTTRPTQQAHGVVCGYCVKQGAGTSGIIYVKIDNGLEFSELHDVLLSGLAAGQGLRLGSDNLWHNHAWTATDVGAVSSVTLTPPAGWSSSSTNTGGSVVLALALPTGYSLPSDASQANWNTAHSERLRWDGGSAGLSAATGRASLGLAAVAASGVYGDLSGRPTLGTAAATDATAYATAAQGALAATAVQPGALASKADLVGGVVPSAQLPGFVDDVLEFANIAAFPATGETGRLYLSLATNRAYRWSGSIYVEINPSPGSTDAVPEGSVNLYFTTARGEAAAGSWWAGSAAKIKLDNIAVGATANSSDAYLLARANHTGTQAASTITGLAASATTDTTNASNISSGTLPAARLPASGAQAGGYGSSTQVPVLIVDAAGRITSASTATISGGGSTAYAVRIDSTSTANTIYVGKAVAGSSESAQVWSITRTQLNAAGVQTGSSSLSSVTWTGRTSHTYP